MDYTLLNKVTLFTALEYFEAHRAETELPKKAEKIYSALKMYQILHNFKPSEVRIILSESDEIKKITARPVSYIVFALHLLKLWSEAVPKQSRDLAISDKHLKYSRAIFMEDMLKLKMKDEETYQKKKEVIDDSIKVAEDFFSYQMQYICK